MNRHVISVLVENSSGVLSRISGLFSRRAYNIDSLSVGTTEDHRFSRMTITVCGDEQIFEQIKKQLNKLIEVIKITELKSESSVCRELMMIRVNSIESRSNIMEIANIFRASIIDVASDSLVLELTGDRNKIDAFQNMLEPFGIKEVVRTGIAGLERGLK
ncbi:MAG: acetolactate synthase small subunit [Clostridiales bacterium]|nr:acetolactate synthase small subunit [Clostridiales bacterium]